MRVSTMVCVRKMKRILKSPNVCALRVLLAINASEVRFYSFYRSEVHDYMYLCSQNPIM